jgi:hypothetical protein
MPHPAIDQDAIHIEDARFGPRTIVRGRGESGGHI